MLHRSSQSNASVHTPPTPAGHTNHANERKTHTKVIPKHDDLYVRAWDCEDGKPVFDAEIDIAMPPNSAQIPIQSDLSTKGGWNTPGAAREYSRELFPQMEELCDVTDTYPYMELDEETTSEQPNNNPTNPRS